MTYKVTCIHHRKCTRKGDIEAEDVIESVNIFKSKKSIVEYLTKRASEAKSKGYKIKLDSKVNGKYSPSLLVYTGYTWFHENTGNTEEEFYWYRLV